MFVTLRTRRESDHPYHVMHPFCCVKNSLIRIWWVMGHSEMTSARVTLGVGSILCGVSLAVPYLYDLWGALGVSTEVHTPPPVTPYHILMLIAPAWAWSISFLLYGVGIFISITARWRYLPHCFATFLGAMLWVFMCGAFFISLASYSVDDLPMLSLSCVSTLTLLACWRFLRVVSDNVLGGK